MKINELILSENDIIPPNQASPADDLEAQDDERWDAINTTEQAMAKQYFAIFQKAGIELFDDQGIPVSVSFDEETATVEVEVTTDDSFSVQSLIALSEAGAITPQTVIRPLSDQKIDITTAFPAAQTPFKRFLRA